MSSNCKHPTCIDAATCRRGKTARSVKPLRKVKKKSIPQLIGIAQKLINAHVRDRDSQGGYFTCISCGKDFPVSKMNAGHYVPVARCSFLRLNELNIHGECVGCNCFDEFHLIGYRMNLVNKIGEETVKWLEDNRHTTKRWTRAELEEIINTYSKRKAA
jgi:hypothetical protein